MHAIRKLIAATLALLVTLAGTALVFAPATLAAAPPALSSSGAWHSLRPALAVPTSGTLAGVRPAGALLACGQVSRRHG
jgi:hypothetical protein